MTEERDPKVSRRYRELGAEEPSRELDQTILAAAHRAADRPHAPLVSPAGRHRWYFALGAAAILVLAVAVTVQIERQQPDAEAVSASPPPTRSENEERFSYYERQGEQGKRGEVGTPAEPPKPLSDVAPGPAPVQEARKERAHVSGRAANPDIIGLRRRDSSEANRVEQPSRPAATPEADVRAREATQAAEVQQAPQAAPAPQAGTMQAPRLAASSAPVSPERLLERVAELRKEGRHDEADKLLAEFRQRYPDYRISAEMLQKVERRK